MSSYCLQIIHINVYCVFVSQHKDDPLFAEFIEAHINDNTAWIKKALQQATNSDEDSGAEDAVVDDKETKEMHQPESSDKNEKPKEEEKIANKHISDLEV